MPSFVYLAESPEVMKVGFSVSPADRIMVFPRRFGRFSLLAAWPGGKREEEKLIRALIGNYQRIYGREWFYRDSRIPRVAARIMGEPVAISDKLVPVQVSTRTYNRLSFVTGMSPERHNKQEIIKILIRGLLADTLAKKAKVA